MIRFIALASCAFALALGSIACSDDATKSTTTETKSDTGAEATGAEAKVDIPEMTVSEVVALIAKPGAKVAVIDANGSETRTSKGVIPGATLLSNYREYALKELPAEKDTKLVFYCGSTSCTASDKAAVRAKKSGYNDVNVLRAGIKGWAEAGQKTAAFKADAK